jgi:hypothetical protein
LAPYGHVPESAVAALCVDPLRRLGSQAVDQLCFLGLGPISGSAALSIV